MFDGIIKAIQRLEQDIRIWKALRSTKMDTVNSYLVIIVSREGHADGRVINGFIEIPAGAVRVPSGEGVRMLPGHVYRFYHRPDCAWFTDEVL